MSLPPWKVPVTFWDLLILGGEPFPGIPQVSVSKSRKVQLSSPKDSDGLTLSDNGYDGAKIKVTLRLWEDEQIDDLYRLLPRFDPSVGDLSVPVEILHPVTWLAGIEYVYITKWDLSSPRSAGGEFSPAFEAVQWFPGPEPTPPQIAPPGPGGGSGRPDNGEDPDYEQPDPNPTPDPDFGANQP